MLPVPVQFVIYLHKAGSYQSLAAHLGYRLSRSNWKLQTAFSSGFGFLRILSVSSSPFSALDECNSRQTSARLTCIVYWKLGSDHTLTIQSDYVCDIY
jgi:hypothetical protein